MAAMIVSKINEPLLFRRRDPGPGASMVTMGFILDHELVFREREDSGFGREIIRRIRDV
jgi:hypothetical protein